MPFDNVKRPGTGGGAHERAINLPPVLLGLIAINVAVHLFREVLSESMDQRLVLNLGMIPANYTADPGGDWWSLLLAPVAYQFLHAGWLHLGVNMMTLAAFGAPLERLLGARRFILFYLSAGIVAGFVHVLIFPDSVDPVIGASGAISGVFGGILMALRRIGRLSSLLPVAGIWIALNVFFGIFGGTPGSGGEAVAWTAHVGGFVYGLLALRLFLPASIAEAPEAPPGGDEA